MFHVYGLTTGLISAVFDAATMILVTRFDAAETLDLLRARPPDVFPLVPAICDAISDELERETAASAKEKATSRMATAPALARPRGSRPSPLHQRRRAAPGGCRRAVRAADRRRA